MSDDSTPLVLVDANTATTFASVHATRIDVDFPTPITWADVLDARIEPFASQSVADVCHFAQHVRKAYVLMPQDKTTAQEGSPPH